MPATSLADAWLQRLLVCIAIPTLLGLVFGILGPFGSYLNDGPLLRTGYWVGSMWAGLLFYGAGYRISRNLAPTGTRAAWPALVVSVLVASVPEAALTRVAAIRIWPELAQSGPGWTTWYAQTLTIGLITVIGLAFLQQAIARKGEPLAAAGPDPAGPPAFAAERLRGDILALQMEDHYVRVHTSAGSDLILMPLGRAIETVATDGLKTHRSWWVARHAVARVDGTARSMSLKLTNGIVAPVSRNAVASLRAAGWLQADP